MPRKIPASKGVSLAARVLEKVSLARRRRGAAGERNLSAAATAHRGPHFEVVLGLMRKIRHGGVCVFAGNASSHARSSTMSMCVRAKGFAWASECQVRIRRQSARVKRPSYSHQLRDMCVWTARRQVAFLTRRCQVCVFPYMDDCIMSPRV